MDNGYRPTAVDRPRGELSTPTSARWGWWSTSPVSRAARIAEELGGLAHRAADPGLPVTEVLSRALQLAADAVRGTQWAALERRDHRGRLLTVAATDEAAATIDSRVRERQASPFAVALDTGETAIHEWEAGGPCPAGEGLAVEPPFPRSAISVPLAAAGHPAVAMTLYSDRTAVYTGLMRDLTGLVAAGLALVLTAVGQRERAENLHSALTNSRQIGAAVGILMFSRALTYDDAFALLTMTSNHRQQKVRDIAEEVILTGQLPGV